ncbi:MAG TPA: GAF domain-containing protein, partial [Puia sp.]
IQTINKTVNRQLEKAMEELQKTYPCYFEKFRTDGVEYDIYIGQSIAPDKVFDLIYLRNLRLWQLTSMATIAMATHTSQMPGRLVTTQLIFVHSNPIDISFRKDERRFDVEGGYNIRYQVVKKRVDKVHIRNSNERLTQPGKIAVIYFNEKEAEEYLGYVKYLQQKGVLEDDLEHLELEELQGVSGLRAFRVGVKLSGPSGTVPAAAGSAAVRAVG